MQLADFDYTLPLELVAQFPPANRGESRSLHVKNDQYQDLWFSDLPGQLQPSDLLVLNDTQVLKARLYGQKPSGGQVELLIERIIEERTALAHIRASKAPKPGSLLQIGERWQLQVVERADDLFVVKLESEGTIAEMLAISGQLPLPPYITHRPTDFDEQRYQTIYALNPGAVAAPTAGLHFTPALLERLSEKGIEHVSLTLHVGAGTFQPVRVENIAEHKMHREWYNIPIESQQKIKAAKAAGHRIVAVGTTSLRALEAASQQGFLTKPSGETDLFITPGYPFQMVDKLITNFHLPKSTLLMLVAAFIGQDTLKAAYQHAIAKRYRFFSYGDALLLERNSD